MFVHHLADLAGRIQAVEHRHLQIHQDHVKGLLRHLLHRLAPVVHHGDHRLDPAQVLHDELLVDTVVFGQQHPGPVQQLPKVLLIALCLGLTNLAVVGAAVEQLVHLGQQGILCHGLGQEVGQPHALHASVQPLPGPGAGHQDGQAPPLAVLIHLEGKIQAILLPHAPVEDGKPDVVALLSQHLAGTGEAVDRDHGGAGPAQYVLGELQHQFVVIHHQDEGLVIEEDPAPGDPIDGLGQGDLEQEGGAHPGLALHPDLPPHQPHQPLGDVEPEPRAAIFAGVARLQLGKGLEQLCLLLRRYADAGVPHAEAHPHRVLID